jgi:UDP-N-acetylmuramoylalanine--D-glutamate ligase
VKTLVYGLGESGIAATRALIERGEEVIVADSNDSERLRGIVSRLGVEGRLGVGPEVLTESITRLVASPGIRPRDAVLVAAKDSGVPVLSEVGLGLSLLKTESPQTSIVAVTGTNGKTTVVGMLCAILAATGVSHAVAGNSWQALTGCLNEAREKGLIVLEISSFQLHYLTDAGFDAAALLNTRPDHLNWHISFEEYAADKLRIFEGQTAEDLALVNATDSIGRGVAEELAAETVIIGEQGTLVEGGCLYQRGRPLAQTGELPFAGLHNFENALFAGTVAEKFGAGLEDIRDGLLNYQIRPHRMQLVAQEGGVTYVDDSKATNPAAVAAALASCEGYVVLILGGSEKKTDFTEVLPHLGRCRTIVCHGEAGPTISEFLKQSGVHAAVCLVPDLSSAVARARESARPGDVVLLSPGCASFDQFAGYAERGVAFARLVSTENNGCSLSHYGRRAVGR